MRTISTVELSKPRQLFLRQLADKAGFKVRDLHEIVLDIGLQEFLKRSRRTLAMKNLDVVKVISEYITIIK